MSHPMPFAALARYEKPKRDVRAIGTALANARACMRDASNDAVREIHARDVGFLELAAADNVPGFCREAVAEAMKRHTPVSVTPDGEDFYAFSDDPVQPIDEAAENYEPDPDSERDAWNEARDEEDAARAGGA